MAFFKAPSKLKISSKYFNGSICPYRVFYLPGFRIIEGGCNPTPPPGPYRARKIEIKNSKYFSFVTNYKRPCIFLSCDLFCERIFYNFLFKLSYLGLYLGEERDADMMFHPRLVVQTINLIPTVCLKLLT